MLEGFIGGAVAAVVVLLVERWARRLRGRGPSRGITLAELGAPNLGPYRTAGVVEPDVDAGAPARRAEPLPLAPYSFGFCPECGAKGLLRAGFAELDTDQRIKSCTGGCGERRPHVHHRHPGCGGKWTTRPAGFDGKPPVMPKPGTGRPECPPKVPTPPLPTTQLE